MLGGPFPDWGAALLAVLFAVLLWRSWARSARLPRRARRWVRLLRSAALGLAWLVLIQPELLRWRRENRQGALAVVLDASASMRFEDADGRSRWAEAVEAARSLLSRQGPASEVRLYLLEEEVRPLEPGERLDANGPPRSVPRSDLAGALDRWLAGLAENPAPPEAVVFLSDGADTEHGDPKRPADRGIPVHTIAFGGSRPLRDRAVLSAEVPPTVPVRDEAHVRVRVRAMGGTSPRRLPVRLWRGEHLLSEAEAELDERGEGEVELPFRLRSRGHVVLRVEVEPIEGDEVPDNDERHLLVEARREHLRILHLAGRPSWDVRFLRAFLKRDPGTQLVSFFILRTEGDETNAAPDELSLIPFPTDELFRQHLDRFDVVILQNFDYEPYGIAPYLPGLARHVRHGGGLVMVGGERAFERGGYAATPLQPLLPVRLLSSASGSRDADTLWEDPFHPVVAPGAESHPLVDLWSDASMGWDRLAPVDLLHRVASVRKDAVVLLQHPSLRTLGGEPAPVLALSWPERGRVAALLTDGSWRWGMPSAARAGDPSSHGRFWDRLLRWAAGDPSLAPCRIQTRRARIPPRGAIAVKVLSRNRAFQPSSGQTVVISVLDEHDALRGERRITLDGEGTWRGDLPAPRRPGGYRIALRQATPRCETWVLVEPGGPEAIDPTPRPGWLRELAQGSGGTYFEGSGHLPTLEALARRIRPRDILERTAPFRSWPVLGVLFLLLATEWRLRRRHGLP